MHWPVTPRDLAPGDFKSAKLNLGRYDLTRIRRGDDPLFEEAYGYLCVEFGPTDGLETREALRQRFQLGPRFLYEMALVYHDENFVAIRDHTAALTRDHTNVVVHLSHNLVAPPSRRTGIAGWMRALPIATARECLAANGGPPHAPITLLAEMDYAKQNDDHHLVRLQAYERAGFRKIDPNLIKYFQPDFRPPAAIDAAGGPRPLPYQLLIRRVHREHERVIFGAEARQMIETLYEIYRPLSRPADLAHPALSLDNYPADDAMIALVPPTQC